MTSTEQKAKKSLNSKFPVLILTTGGTIEKTYNESDGQLSNNENSGIKGLIKWMRIPYTQVYTHFVMAKDSLLMNDLDREQIYQCIIQHFAENIPIIIIHGTDTMEHTLRYVYDRMPQVPVPVIFTGAMRPLEFVDSDAKQNVIEALYAARIATPGIYISFHGRLFSAPGVRKNRERMTFEAF